jgi:hypothetical protein
MARQLGDASFAGPGLRSSFFLFRQPFIVWPAIVGALAWGAWMISLTAQNEQGTIESIVILGALLPVMGLGVAVLTGLPGFMVYRLLTAPKQQWRPERGEEELYRAKANHFLGDEGRGGTAIVSTRRISFVPHRLNVQLEDRDIAIEAIDGVAWRRIVNGRGMTMSTVVVLTTSTGDEVIVIKRAEAVADLIEALRDLTEAARASGAKELMAILE